MKYILSLKYSVSNNVIQVESTETINEITIQEEDEENIENFLADLKRLEIVQDLNFRLGTIHKGRLLKGVGRWVHQKEIY